MTPRPRWAGPAGRHGSRRSGAACSDGAHQQAPGGLEKLSAGRGACSLAPQVLARPPGCGPLYPLFAWPPGPFLLQEDLNVDDAFQTIARNALRNEAEEELYIPETVDVNAAAAPRRPQSSCC